MSTIIKTAVGNFVTPDNQGNGQLESVLVGSVIGGILGLVVVCLLIIIVGFIIRQRSLKRRTGGVDLTLNSRNLNNLNTAIYDESEYFVVIFLSRESFI